MAAGDRREETEQVGNGESGRRKGPSRAPVVGMGRETGQVQAEMLTVVLGVAGMKEHPGERGEQEVPAGREVEV